MWQEVQPAAWLCAGTWIHWFAASRSKVTNIHFYALLLVIPENKLNSHRYRWQRDRSQAINWEPKWQTFWNKYTLGNKGT